MTITEILSKAAMNTLLGMGTVFVMLVLISCIISLFKFIPQPGASKKQKEEAAKTDAASSPATAADGKDDCALIAVITAAIAAAKAAENGGASFENEADGAYIVRSIKRRGK